MISYGAARYIITTSELKELYNEAIEEAALIVQPNPHVDEERRCEDIAAKIRKLKK